MRRLLAAAVLLAVAPLPAAAGPASARVDPRLLSAAGTVTAFLHAGTTDAAVSAAGKADLQVIERFDRVGVAVAVGTPAGIRRVARIEGVSYVEDAEVPIALSLDTAGLATRNTEAQKVIRHKNGSTLSGKGISVAVVDGGIDGTHPFFGLDGPRKVVNNLKYACTDVGALVAPGDTCWVAVPGNDTDTGSAGGHGTHVAGIVAGVPTELRNPLTGASRTVRGAAPGANLVGLSVGTSLSINGGTSGLNWVLNHHRAPCGAGVSTSSCPPIRVVNNSWGPAGGAAHNPAGAVAKVQRALVADGVVVVWSAGNSGGDGSGKGGNTGAEAQLTNGNGADPTPGVLMVAAYDDGGTGSSNGGLASFSSRGVKGMPDTYPDLSAPGSAITSACRPTLTICAQGGDSWDGPDGGHVGTFNTISGTSMAAPFVSGVVAELLALDPTLTPADVERVLENGAHRFGADYEPDPANPGSPTSFDKGHGLLDVLASADLVQKRKARRQLPGSCGVAAWEDAAGDANGVVLGPQAGPDHPAADLRAGRWDWDGRTLTLVFVMADVSPSAWRSGVNGSYVSAQVQLGSSSNLLTIVGGTGAGESFYVFDADQTTGQARARGQVVDRLGTGADEIRVSFTDDDLAVFGETVPTLAKGLRLTTRGATGAYWLQASFVTADRAVGSCPVVLKR